MTPASLPPRSLHASLSQIARINSHPGASTPCEMPRDKARQAQNQARCKAKTKAAQIKRNLAAAQKFLQTEQAMSMFVDDVEAVLRVCLQALENIKKTRKATKTRI